MWSCKEELAALSLQPPHCHPQCRRCIEHGLIHWRQQMFSFVCFCEIKWHKVVINCYLLCWRVLGSSWRLSATWDKETGACLADDMLPCRVRSSGRIRSERRQTRGSAPGLTAHPGLWKGGGARVEPQQGLLVALRRPVTWRDIRPRRRGVRRQRHGRLAGVLSWKVNTEATGVNGCTFPNRVDWWTSHTSMRRSTRFSSGVLTCLKLKLKNICAHPRLTFVKTG